MLNAALFLVKTISDLYLLTFVFRFVLQLVRADFYNPLSQFAVRVTNPLVVRARRFVPSVAGLDMATLVVLVLLQCIVTLLLLAMIGAPIALDTLALLIVLRLISLTIWLYSISLILYVILSWFAQAAYSPIAMLLGQIVGPVLRPLRRFVPPIGGIDLSPWLALLLLQALLIALPLPPYLR